MYLGASAVGVNVRHRNTFDVAVYRQGAATNQTPPRHRALRAASPWRCCSLLTTSPDMLVARALTVGLRTGSKSHPLFHDRPLDHTMLFRTVSMAQGTTVS